MTTTTSHLPNTKFTPTSNDDLATLVWVTMGEIYGNQWTNAFGEEPNRQWVLEIGNLTMREVLYGIEQSKRSGSQFVPNLPQFLAYCKAGNKVICEGTKKLLALPKPPPNPEIKRAFFTEALGRRERMSDEERETRRLAMEIAAEILMQQQEVTA